MPDRQHTTSRINRRDPDLRYTRAFRGYGTLDIMAEWAEEMQEYVITGDLTDYKGMVPSYWEIGGERLESAIQFVPHPVNAMIVTPWTDNSQRLDLTTFDIDGDNQNHWCDFVRDSEGHVINFMFNAQPPLTQGVLGYTSLLSRFALPRNPLFAVRLIRFQPADSVTDAARRQLATTITFGILTQGLQDEIGETKGAMVRLVMPFGAPAQLWWKHDTYTGNEWEPMLGSPQSLRWGSMGGAPTGMGNAQFATIWVACLRGGVAVSTDRFRDEVFYQRFPVIESQQDVGKIWAGYQVEGWVPDVPAGFVRLGNNAGFWGCSFLPLLFGNGEDATLYGPLHEVGYEDPGFLAEEKVLQARTRRKTQPIAAASDAYVQVEDVSGTPGARRATDNTKREWRATFVETQWSHTFTRAGQQVPMQRYSDISPIAFTCHVSPELYSVSMAELPTVEGSGAYAETALVGVQAVSCVSGADSRAVVGQLVLDNEFAEHREMRIQGAQEVTVELGYALDDGTTEYTQILTGILSDPIATDEPITISTIAVSVPDFMAILTAANTDAMLPCFDGWPVWRALQFLLRRAGFADAEMGIVIDASDHYTVDMTDVTKGIEDTGAYLSMGPPEDPLWEPDANNPLDGLIARIANYDSDGEVWFHSDGTFTKGCRHCRRRRDGSDPNGAHHPHRHQGPNSTGCQAYDVVRAGNAQGVDIELYSPVSELVSSGETYFGNEIRSMRTWNVRGDRRRFANRVQVWGPKQSGAKTVASRRHGDPTTTIAAVVHNLDSIEEPGRANYAHGEILHAVHEPALMSEGEAKGLARQLYARLSVTTERIEIELPLNPAIQKGQVFRVHGGDISLDVRDHVFRVEFVEHQTPAIGLLECSTTIGGVYLRTEVAA